MATMVQEPTREQQEPVRRTWADRLLVPEMWAAVAIAVMWVAVLFVGVFGSDLTIANTSGTTVMPVAVPISLFAVIGTAVVARHGFGRRS